MPTKAELMSRLAAARVEVVRLSALKRDITDLQAKNHELRMKAAEVPALLAREKEQAKATAALQGTLILADLEIKKLKASAINHKTATDALKADFGLLAAKASERRRQDKTTIDSLNDDLKSVEAASKTLALEMGKIIDDLKADLISNDTAIQKLEASLRKEDKATGVLREKLGSLEAKVFARREEHKTAIDSLNDDFKSLDATFKTRALEMVETIDGLKEDLILKDSEIQQLKARMGKLKLTS